MNALNAVERRLIATLELLSSDYEGERHAAADAAYRLIRRSGIRISDLVGDAEPRLNACSRRPEHPYARWDDWRSAVAACRQYPHVFTPWQRDFARSLAGFPRISRKQSAILHEMAGRLDRTLREAGR